MRLRDYSLKKTMTHSNLETSKSKSKFALVIDLRSFNDNDVAGNGRKIINTQSGVLLEITKEGGFDTLIDVYCSIYVVSDGQWSTSQTELFRVLCTKT